MQLLGSYKSQLSTWYYNELIDLVNTAISKGDYAGGYTFNPSNIQSIVNSQTLLSNLTLPAAGDRAIDEDFNNPLSLLAARFSAIATELDSFTAKISILIDILNKDTTLLDQLIYATKLNVWVNTLPKVLNSVSFNWSFGVGFGRVGFNLSYTDPANSVVYTNPPRRLKYYDISSSTTSVGLVSDATTTIFPPKDISWIYDAIGFDEVNYGIDWAELAFLENDILLTFKAPQLNVILPDNSVSSPFSVSGTSTTKGIPVYIRTLFSPRVSTTSINTGTNLFASTAKVNILPGDQINVSASVIAATNTNGSCSLYLQYRDSSNNLVVNSASTPIRTLLGSLTESGTINNLVTTASQSNIVKCELVLISTGVTIGSYTLASQVSIKVPIRLTNGYSIDPTSVAVYSASTFYNINQDYAVTGKGYITLINVPDQSSIVISFTEYFPCYQCSINQTVWSQIIMFDYNRPYQDSETEFLPIPIGVDSNGVRNLLPVIDEAGIATGLYISLNSVMMAEYLLNVYQDADASNPGKSAQLVIEFGQPRYMNVLNLASYTNFPVNIRSIDVQGFAANTLVNLFTGNFLLDKPTAFRFPTTLISTVTVTIFQENYTIKQHQIIPDDYIRREAINDLQAVIPVAAQEPNILPEVLFANGYQYEFGIENISGANEVGILPTVSISGNYRVKFRPSSFTFYARYLGTVSFYLCYNAFDSNGALLDSNTTGLAITPGSTIAFPFSTGFTLSDIANVDIYIKAVLRTYNACLQTFNIQVD